MQGNNAINKESDIKILQAIAGNYLFFFIWTVILAALYIISLYSYLLFHSLAELFSIVIALSIFVIAWNTRNFSPNSYLLFMGITFLYVAFVDLIHTLSYKGMGVFERSGGNLSTQLWIAGRYMEGISFLVAPYFIGKKLRIIPVFIVYFVISATLLLSIFYGFFPATFIEGTGLTLFKIISEYLISLILVAAIIYLRKKKEYFEKPVLYLLIWSIIVTIASEMSFTLYVDVYGFLNTLGHYFKIVSFYLIYTAIIKTNLLKPYEAMALEMDERKKAEDMLKEKEHLLSESQRIAHIGSWVWALTGPIKWTDETYRIYGVSQETFTPTVESLVSLLHPEDRPAMQRWIEDCRAGQSPDDLEFRVILPDGSVRLLSGRGELTYDTENRPVYIAGTVQDITVRKKAEEELRITNEELLAINRIITTTTTTTTGVKQILETVLDEALRITGLEGGTIWMVTPDETLHLAAHRETSEATILDLTTNAIKVGECLCGECAREHKPLILWNREDVLKFATREVQRGEDIRFHAAFPLITGERCLGVLCVFTRTDKKLSKRSLKLIETASLQISIAIENARLYEETIHYAANMENEVKIRTNDLEKSKQALLNLLEDLNKKTEELKQANEKLKELDHLKSMFIASMSHELRTPLNSVIGFSSVLLKEWAGPVNEEQKRNIATILRSGRHLLALINDIIDISKIETGKIDIVRENFDIKNVISEAVSSFSKEIEEKGLKLQVECLSLLIYTEKRRLLQCLLNLISNAVKFTEKGSVRIAVGFMLQAASKNKTLKPETCSLKLNEEFIEISVEDTSIGIKEEDIPKLFQSFVRLDSPLKSRVAGTGLGLYLTKKIVTEILKGEIYVESRYGVGSKFVIKMPVKI